MLNEHQEFLEYTLPYENLTKGNSVWGRISGDVFKGIGFERYLTIIARGFLYHDFKQSGEIKSTYASEQATERIKKTAAYLKFWLTGNDGYISSYSDKFKPCTLPGYLEAVKKECEDKLESSVETTSSNYQSYKKTIDQIDDFLSEAHAQKIISVIRLWESFGEGSEVDISNRLKLISKNIPADATESLNECNMLCTYFSDYNTQKSKKLYDRFYDYTQYDAIITYKKNININSIIVTALQDGPLMQVKYFSVKKSVLGNMLEAMKENNNYRNAFLTEWIILLYVAAYFKTKSYTLDNTEYVFHPIVIALLGSWPKNDNKDKFSTLFNKGYEWNEKNNVVLVRHINFLNGKSVVKLAIYKDIMDGITILNEETNREDAILFKDCGADSFEQAQKTLNKFRKEYISAKLEENKKQRLTGGKNE